MRSNGTGKVKGAFMKDIRVVFAFAEDVAFGSALASRTGKELETE